MTTKSIVDQAKSIIDKTVHNYCYDRGTMAGDAENRGLKYRRFYGEGAFCQSMRPDHPSNATWNAHRMAYSAVMYRDVVNLPGGGYVEDVRCSRR